MESFYVFTAGPEVSGHGHSKAWVQYGTEFAQFILDNKLGTIATCGQKLNTKYPRDTTCQTWIWSPDEAAVIAWYNKRVKLNKVPSPRLNSMTGVEICPNCKHSYSSHTGWNCPSNKGVWPE